MGAAVILQGAVTGINKAYEIVQAINKLKMSVEVNTKVIELQEVILTAQSNAFSAFSEQQTMLEKISDLEKELAKVKAWEAEKEKYELKRVGYGAYAYVIKDSMK